MVAGGHRELDDPPGLIGMAKHAPTSARQFVDRPTFKLQLGWQRDVQPAVRPLHIYREVARRVARLKGCTRRDPVPDAPIKVRVARRGALALCRATRADEPCGGQDATRARMHEYPHVGKQCRLTACA